jgi:hypothetical protein
VNNELEGTWKEDVVAQFEILSLGTRETTEILSENIRFPGRDLKRQPPAYEIRMLPKFGSVCLINLHSNKHAAVPLFQIDLFLRF